MKKFTYLLAFVSVFLLPAPAKASIEWIHGEVLTSDFRKTTIPVLQGRTTQYVLKGEWLDKVNEIENLGNLNYASFQGLAWPARLVVNFRIDENASVGTRRIRLVENTKDFWGNPKRIEHDWLDIYIVRAGIFSSESVITVPTYFNEAQVAVSGNKIGNAAVITDLWPAGTTAFVSESSNTRVVVTVRFSSSMAEASGDILLYDKDMPSLCKNLMGTYFYKVSGTTSIRKRVTIRGPNAIKSISFPNGTAYNSGQTVTVRLTFYRPLAQNAVIYWRLSSKEGNVLAQAVSPTTYDPNAQYNARTAASGASYVDLTVRVCGCLGGVWTVTVNTWFGSINTTGPGFQQKSFTVSCPAGGVSCP